jgi:poly-gamma-glutamate synthesis protein (capsule biosynthesis protein)
MKKSIVLISVVLLAGVICFCFRSSTGRDIQRFSILFVGDILLANEAERHIHDKGLDYPFWKIKEELLKYDFIFANMESPITRRGIPVIDKPYIFRVKPEDAVCLKDLKIDAVSISNNHLMDYNHEGMVDTIATLDRLNIMHTGGGRNLAEARRPALLKYGYTNIIILAYCNRPPLDHYATDDRPGIAPLDIQIIRDDIAAYKLSDNIVVVSLHWGIEQTSRPQSAQIAMAHQIIDASADAVVGHHPHWPQGIEIYRNKPVIYSLGNFINGYINPIEQDNIAVALYYAGTSLERMKVIPLAGRNRQIRFQPYVLTGNQADRFLGFIKSLSCAFNTEIEIKNSYGFIDLSRQPALASTKHMQPPVAGNIKNDDVKSRPPAGPAIKTGSR